MTKILTKIGNAYATTDLAYRLTKHADKKWHLFIAADGYSHLVGNTKDEAIARAEEIIARRAAEDALPWDRVLRAPEKVFSDKYHNSEAENPCVCCGRNCGNNPLHVIIVGGGHLMCKPEDAKAFEGHDRGWLGAFPVGRECAKQFADGYLTTI